MSAERKPRLTPRGPLGRARERRKFWAAVDLATQPGARLPAELRGFFGGIADSIRPTNDRPAERHLSVVTSLFEPRGPSSA